MGRSQLLLSIFLLLPLLFSVGHGAAPSFHDIWNLVLPHPASPTEAAAVPDHFPHGEMRSRLPTSTIGEAGDQGSSGEVTDHSSKTRVDAGTKAWPFVYYNRRDREGTLDWGTKSWPYIYFSKKEDKGDLTASSDAAGAAAVNYGRKAGGGFRL